MSRFKASSQRFCETCSEFSVEVMYWFRHGVNRRNFDKWGDQRRLEKAISVEESCVFCGQSKKVK